MGCQVLIILKVLCLEYLCKNCQVAHLVVMSVCTSFTCEQSCKCDVYLGEAGRGSVWDLHGGEPFLEMGMVLVRLQNGQWPKWGRGWACLLSLTAGPAGGAAASGLAVKLSGTHI